MWDFLVRMMPPNLGFIEKLWKPALESLQVAIWGTLLGVVISLPICFFAARNLSPASGDLPCHPPGAELHARHQRDHPGADLRRRHRPRPVRRRARPRHSRRRHARQILRRGDGGYRRRPARSVPLGRRRPVQDLLLRRAAAGAADLARHHLLPPGDQRPSVHRARHGRRRRHRLRTRLVDEALPVSGHGDLHSRDPGDGAGHRPASRRASAP